MKMLRFLVLAGLCIASWPAGAQWQWIDKDGRKVYSDRAPPLEVPEQNILKQPHARRAPAAAPAAAPAGEAAANPAPAQSPKPAPAPNGKDKALEKKKAEAEAQEAAKEQAAQEQQQAKQADNCQRARNMKKTFESGGRIVQTNNQGERVVVDDAARAAELKRLQGIIDSSCTGQ